MKIVSALLALTLLGAAILPAMSQGKWGDSFSPGEARSAVDKGDAVPLKDVFGERRQRYGGYQIDANLYQRAGREVYVIDWMTEKGERVRVTVDARTGRIQS